MEKREIRKEFITLKSKHSFIECRSIIKKKFNYTISIKTLRRWLKVFNSGDWSCEFKSTRPHKIHTKLNNKIIEEVIKNRKEFGWGCQKLYEFLQSKYETLYNKNYPIKQITINKILKENNLLRTKGVRGSKKKWIRYERKHPNSLWHIDDSNYESHKIIQIVDDCSRYNIGILYSPKVNTKIVTSYLDILISKYGLPKEIISDNGSPYGLRSISSKFDKWCKKRYIKHIRGRVNHPQTNGKVERKFKTIDDEIKFCKNDLEYFRYRYNHIRPHLSLDNKTPSDVFNDFIKWI